MLFQEVQYFRQPLLWVIVGGVSLLLLGSGIALLVASRMTSPALLRGVGAILLLLGIAIPTILYSTNLTTEVRSEGIFTKFFPLQMSYQQLPLQGLRSHTVRDYRPLGEFGGWGIRYGRSGKALTVSGDRGVQLVYGDGTAVLIGSQRAEDLDRAIEQALSGAQK